MRFDDEGHLHVSPREIQELAHPTAANIAKKEKGMSRDIFYAPYQRTIRGQVRIDSDDGSDRSGRHRCCGSQQSSTSAWVASD